MNAFPQNESCRSCGTDISQPADACPNCNAHLFWLVIPKRALSALEIRQFVDEMLTVTSQSIDRDYLVVDDHLWLPGDFWQRDPEGSSLRIFPWISELELHQHGEAAHQVTTDGSGVIGDGDTMPGVTEAELAALEHREREALREKEVAAAAPVQSELPNDLFSETPPQASPVVQAKERAQPRQPRKVQAVSAVRAARPKPIAPIALFLFFVLLAASFLSLYIQKNKRDIAFAETRPTALEVPEVVPEEVPEVVPEGSEGADADLSSDSDGTPQPEDEADL